MLFHRIRSIGYDRKTAIHERIKFNLANRVFHRWKRYVRARNNKVVLDRIFTWAIKIFAH